MKNILLIGTGRFGRHIAVQLSQLGHQVMAVDTNEERISDVLPYVTNAQIGDSTNAEFLRSLGIGNFCSGARSLANRARSVSNITPA